MQKIGLNEYGASSDIAYRPNSTTSTDKYNDVLRRRRGKRHCHCSTFAEGNETNYAKVKEKFDQHFIVKRNVIFERAKFNMRTQEPGEPIDVFITDPYGLSEHCEFGAIREELIRDRRGGITRCKAKRKTDPQDKKQTKCMRCGSTSENHLRLKCPSRDTTCVICYKRGHFVKVCLSTPKKVGAMAADDPAKSFYISITLFFRIHNV